MPIDLEFLVVANAKLQIFGDLPKGLSPFLSTQLNFLSDTNNFEKKKKIIKALKGVEEMRKNVDALLIVNNERLCDVYTDSELSVKEAFQRADHILMDAVKGISELITMPSDGGIKSDFRDVETTMKNGGGAIMAMGRASGEPMVMILAKPNAYSLIFMPATNILSMCVNCKR